MSAGLAAEISAVRARGTTVVPILPTVTDLAGLSAHFMSSTRRVEAFEHSMTTAPDTVRAALDAAGV
jgi:NTE family protein